MSLPGRDLSDFQDTLGYRYRDISRLERALTHSSLKKSKADPSYERLEFLGDRVLGLVIAELLLQQYPNSAEGKLAPRLAALVSGKTLGIVARSIDLGVFIRMTQGEKGAGTNQRASVLADCCEAVIGSLYLDGGLDAARDFVVAQWTPLIAEVQPRVAKTELQEWAQGHGLPLPEYTVVHKEGPPHDPVFTVELAVENQQPVQAKGPSKQSAEQSAAAKMLAAVSDDSGENV